MGNSQFIIVLVLQHVLMKGKHAFIMEDSFEY